MPWLTIYAEEDADAAELLKRAGDAPVLVITDEDGCRVGYAIVVTHSGANLSPNAERQRRYRQKKRNARVTRVSNARNAPEDENSEQFSGDITNHGPSGAMVVGYPLERNAALRVTRNAETVTPRNASEGENPLHPSIAALAADMHLTDTDRETGRAGVAAAMRHNFDRDPKPTDGH